MAWVIFLTIEMGRIEQLGGSAIVTRFRVVNGLPLRAYDSQLVVNDGQRTQHVPIPTVTRSMLAGYGRVWLPVLTVVLGSMGAVAWPHWHLTVPALAGALASGLASAYFLLRFGHLSPPEVRRRLAYAVWLRAPVDIGLVPESADYPFEAKLREFLDERAALVPEGYRERLSPEERWKTAAMASSDPELLIAALTRARWERRRARGKEQASLDALHDALWTQLDPLLVAGKGPPAYVAWERYVSERDARIAGNTWKHAAVVAVAGVLSAIARSSSPRPPRRRRPRRCLR